MVGTGFVGSTFAFALLNQSVTEEIVLIDMNSKKAEGEAMDLNHAVPFASSPTKIWQGDYNDCRDANIVCITAGVSQSEEVTRLTVAEKNTKITTEIVECVMTSGFNGILLIASNPVDVMTYMSWKVSGLPKNKVLGSGTILDTARYVHLLGSYFEVDTKNIQGYILGEHGDSQFPVTSQLTIGGQNIKDLIQNNKKYNWSDIDEIAIQAQQAAYLISELKGPTYYGIGMSLMRLTRAIVKNENAILPISAYVNGEYGERDIYIGVPALVNRNGWQEIYELSLNEDEHRKFKTSADTLKETLAPLLKMLNQDEV
ncbi:L-lactate dehydrogenase [Sporosarcina sp. P2]|uniref:L-lactate dehydrogenase n=1 Tax=Sporosarcina sp. P2 TaxID=2048251 RepID=UPI000C1629CE|nr:L-lactate dehydrogenase [Sporosarcina sp. P2]PID02498.1 L-lactate dehydrogenase [Sporosarcina sp. P2]